ncbi:MAG: hypothetical protein HY833_02480 [Candidatus Aenigmarchaeota archaeon]|nr:hypothetical protein [Candidatus Aenigmarchaeota archaeon]
MGQRPPKGFGSWREYNNHWAGKRGFGSRTEHNDELARNKGFENYTEYQKHRVTVDRGFESKTKYNYYLAKKRGFGSYVEYQNSLAVKRGFKDNAEYQRVISKIDATIALVLGNNRYTPAEISSIIREWKGYQISPAIIESRAKKRPDVFVTGEKSKISINREGKLTDDVMGLLFQE